MCFYLKCQGKSRGYIERQERVGGGGGQIEHAVQIYNRILQPEERPGRGVLVGLMEVVAGASATPAADREAVTPIDLAAESGRFPAPTPDPMSESCFSPEVPQNSVRTLVVACCRQCRGELRPRRSRATFCSGKCRAAWHRRRHEAERAALVQDLRVQLEASRRREEEARVALDGVRRLAEIALARLADGRETSGREDGS